MDDIPNAIDIKIDVKNKGKPIYLNPISEVKLDDFSSDFPVCMQDYLYSNRLSTKRGGPLFFKDIAKEIGVDVLQQDIGRFKDGKCSHEVSENGYHADFCDATYMLCGVSVADLNGDGYDEIIVSRLMKTPKVFKNYGDGTYADVTEEVGLGITDGPFPDTAGVAVGDIDNDGDVDIYFSTYGQDQYAYLFINDGTGHFTEESEARGVQNIHVLSKTSGTSVTFGDFDNDGHLDVVTGEWLAKAARLDGSPDSEGFKIYKNKGARSNDCPKTPSSPFGTCEGFFEDITDDLNLYVFGCTFIDLNDDAWDDLFCIIDFGNTRMFLNDGAGSFLPQPYQPPNHVFSDPDIFEFSEIVRNEEYGRSGVVDAMGSTFGDINEDGHLDIFLSAISCPGCTNGRLFYGQKKSGNRLYIKGEGFHMQDKTVEYGVIGGGWGWGTTMFDFDNDGDLDIAMVNGFDFPGSTEDILATDSKLFENVLSCESGRSKNKCMSSSDTPGMVENGEFLGFSADKGKGRGLISFDYDYDGDLGLFVMDSEGISELFENMKGNEMDWLKVNVVESSSGRSSIDAFVYVRERGENDAAGTSENQRTQSTKWRMRKMGPSSFYLGTGEQVTHFGLGSPSTDPINTVKVFWPKTNNTIVISDVPRNTQLRVTSLPGRDVWKTYHHIDSVPQCPYLTIAELSQPLKGGSVAVDAMEKHIIYFPSAEFNGTIEFNYEVKDAAASSSDELTDSGKVTLNVKYDSGEMQEPSKFPPLNGKNNNPNDGNIGCPFMALGRVSSSEYSHDSDAILGPYDTPITEGIDDAHEDARPSAREISNVLFKQTNKDKPSKSNLNDLFVHMGQMIVHDTDFSTPFANGDLDDMMGIKVPKGDPVFDENGEGGKQIRFRRSGVDDNTGSGFNVNREQFNKVTTSFIDLSQVYSPSWTRLMSMRSQRSGKLRIDEDTGYLPLNTPLMQLANPLEKELEFQLLSGDNRANVHPALLAIHSLFHLEHNRICDGLKDRFGAATSDENLFQHARVRLIAKFQSIVYNEWLPALLGPNLKLAPYAGYNPDVKVEIKNEFATAAARFGHSQVNNVQLCFEADNTECPDGHLLLRDGYFKPGVFRRAGMGQLLKGMFAQPAQEVDTFMVDALRDFLFGTHAFPLDLASVNIQRGRDHGLADFNQVRQDLGLPRYATFEEITSDKEVAEKMKSLYNNKIDNIDLFVGGLAEDKVPGGNLGPTFGTIIKTQFELLRDGDRFYFENNANDLMSEEEVQEIKSSGLCDILRGSAWGAGSAFEKSVPHACSENKPFLFVPETQSKGTWWTEWDADVLPVVLSVVATLLCISWALYMFVKADKLEIKWKTMEVRERQDNPIFDKGTGHLEEEKHGEKYSILCTGSIVKEMQI
ncbi:hypothetical protein TrVE_jg759 [Triparma verrucosa]|uniref:ASPIC/UnbV domain-containing protein n=1 Tax=Triparma verrucosa TaxID=1606542 RepID=A0A9W7FBY6_9STRA|nr:hypothetical protein TrVE_jg759 [Triparma verrucosa]